jgi:hypothetical protein
MAFGKEFTTVIMRVQCVFIVAIGAGLERSHILPWLPYLYNNVAQIWHQEQLTTWQENKLGVFYPALGSFKYIFIYIELRSHEQHHQSGIDHIGGFK